MVRRLNADDVREHDKVSSQAFVYSCDIEDKSSALPSEIMLGAFLPDNKTLMADMEIGDRLCIYGDTTLHCAAVGGVASKPEYRGKGAVKVLFAELFNEDWDISILYPFSDAYYRRLGYESIGRALKITMPFRELKGVERNCDGVLYEGGESEKLLEIYNKYAKKKNLCFIRTNAAMYSDKPYESCQYTYVFDNSYITFSTSRSDYTVYVKELIFNDRNSLEKALGFLKNFEGNYDRIVFEKLPLDTPVVNYISDCSKAELVQKSTGFARVHNFEKVLNAHKYPCDNGKFVVEIQGDDTYAVTVAEGQPSVVKGSGEKAEAVLDINAASKILLSGIKSVEEAEYMNGVEIVDKQTEFFSFFPENDGFLNDEF